MTFVNRPYGNDYYEVERVVVRDGPYGADYRIDEYGNRVYYRRNDGLGNSVTEIVTDIIPGTHASHDAFGNSVTEIVTDIIPGRHARPNALGNSVTGLVAGILPGHHRRY
ncbi:hypothetical protein SOVF_066770 [Spinacia oleracea]|uniref:OCRE domain-containing protein n=1 Tax=Spinacia oleracea TaxID=3562 RepID=A0A9R0JTM4_SPIOL|nr:uncharacterized protein LOC110786436 [Spinacia oleracea]KNA18876.1 hypothetical protein SOVF_066770 [Spinacia oleracea]